MRSNGRSASLLPRTCSSDTLPSANAMRRCCAGLLPLAERKVAGGEFIPVQDVFIGCRFLRLRILVIAQSLQLIAELLGRQFQPRIHFQRTPVDARRQGEFASVEGFAYGDVQVVDVAGQSQQQQQRNHAHCLAGKPESEARFLPGRR